MWKTPCRALTTHATMPTASSAENGLFQYTADKRPAGHARWPFLVGPAKHRKSLF
jgi:hypothetical protein